MGDDKWNNLPRDLLIDITERLDVPGKLRFSAVSKSWKLDVPRLRPPYLLLSEVTVAASTVSEDTDEDDGDTDGDDVDDDDDGMGGLVEGIHYRVVTSDSEDTDGDDDDGIDVIDGDEDVDEGIHNYEVHGDGARGLFCLSTGKTYNIELPQASGKLILGTNKGWLLTLGEDLKINLLHPFSKHQVPLPDMLKFKTQYVYDKFPPQSVFDNFISKVAMSSTVPTSGDIPRPIIMAIYGEFRMLGFARLGDKVWTDVETDSGGFNDIVYHKNKFYAVNCAEVHVCEFDDEKRGAMCTEIASLPRKVRPDTRPNLVESSSGDLLLIVRFRKGDPYQSLCTRKYYTTKFLLWKMEQTYSEHDELCKWNWIPVTNLENESLFIGRTSSFSVSSSETIKPNCIYFTDDSEFFSTMAGGGGHDMGIFSIEHGTIEPHFRGKSTHPISPPLWYI